MPNDSVAGKKNQPLEDDTPGGSGSYSILGYEYQIDVSVWLAIDLVLASRLAQELVLEPATEEDVEADLAENEPGRITNEISIGSYRLIVQAKRRSGDAWTVAGLKALLKHGKTRKSAAKRLEDLNARYLLVTSAGLNGGTRSLQVGRAGIWPKMEGMPTSIKQCLPKDAAGRVAVIGGQSEKSLWMDIKTLLVESFRIPHNRLKDCHQTLRSEARVRIGGAGAGRWSRRDLEQIVRQHGGYIASSPELDQYVHPTNWAALRSAMQERYAALIIGQSGTGKTMATRKLYDELREIIPGLVRIPITLGPQQLIGDTTESPVFYDIEDPWGRYDFDPTSRPWNDQLSRFFSEARHDRVVVATSRRDVAQATGALEFVKPWVIDLEAEHYGKKERQLLYQTRIDALPRKLQGLAKRSEKQVLSELATPLEIQKFFDALTTIEGENYRNSVAFITEAIRRAHQNSIERTVTDQIEARQDVCAATIIWSLLKANEKFSISLLRQIEEELSEKGTQYEKGVSPLLNFFVAARNLRQIESTVSYYHPRVEAGIEQALIRERLLVKKTLRHLIEILLSPDGPGEIWGAGSAARLLLAIGRTPELKPKLSYESQEKIDSWLATELAKGGSEFETNLNLAASTGSHHSDVSEAARFLLNRPDKSFASMNQWCAPAHEDTWYARMRTNPNVQALAEKFVREILPNTRDYFDIAFVAEIEKLGSCLTPAFLAAAEKLVHYGYISSADVIAEGALNDISSFEKIIDIAIEVTTPNEAEILANAKTQLAIINGEYNDEYAEYISDNDDGWTAAQFIDAYAQRVRRTVGWQWIAEHRHNRRLRYYWLRAMANAESLSSEEVVGAFAVAFNTEDEDGLWNILVNAWNPDFLQKLIDRNIKGHSDQSVRLNALSCVIKNVPGQIAHISQILLRQNHLVRFIELAIDIGEWHRRSSRGPEKNAEVPDIITLVSGAPLVFQEISAAAIQISVGAPPTLSETGIQFLISVPDVSEIVRAFRLILDRHFSVFVADDVRWLLSNTIEHDYAVEAIDAAIRHGMTNEIEGALSHRFADVIARALQAFASPLEAPLPAIILNLVAVKGIPVRKSLVDLLDSKPHVAHLPALLILARDKWSRHLPRNEDEDYPIAQAAVAAISKLGPLNSEVADQLYQLAINTQDSDLRYAIFVLLMRSDRSFQTRLFELATSPGRLTFRRSAAHALLVCFEHAMQETLAQITPQLLIALVEDIASRLLLLLSMKGRKNDLLNAVKTLTTHAKRRVLVLLAIWGGREQSPLVAIEIASMLPANHVAVIWALEGAQEPLNETHFEDLGDPHSVEQVLLFMQPKQVLDS